MCDPPDFRGDDVMVTATQPIVRLVFACSFLAAAFGPALAATFGQASDQAISQPPANIQLAQRKQQQSSGGNLAGRYAILREENKDSGCLLILNAGGRAQLGPGCRDQGLVVFDPIGWAAGRNAIILRARKGHRITLNLRDGLYVREPAEKRPFVLRKF